MSETRHEFVAPQELRIGMYVELEVGWMAHPFPKGSFKITSEKQIEVILGLGLDRVRYIPGKSDIFPADTVSGSDLAPPAVGDADVRQSALNDERDAREQRAKLIGSQQRSLLACERQFSDAMGHYKKTIDLMASQPKLAGEQCRGMVEGFVTKMLGDGESAIRLLSEGAGDRAAMHPVNVTVVSLLLGKAMGLAAADMTDLGVAAFLHDIGKVQLPERVRRFDENFSTAEYKVYQDHVAQGILLAKSMGLSNGALLAIAQHHELMDGSGFPSRLKGESLTVISKILALVNRYENLCNPARPSAAMTPHEALSLIFTQLKQRFDGVALGAFIRMMGVYPPGSVVQLVDERFAIVVSVNSSRPLKPRLVVHDPAIPKHEALILDLEHAPAIGIRRSLKPLSLPKAALDYLSPRQRICYFFEPAIDVSAAEVAA